MQVGLPRWQSGKESACQCRRHGFNSWLRKIPWRKWQPLLYSCLGNPMDRGYLVGYVGSQGQTRLSIHAQMQIRLELRSQPALWAQPRALLDLTAAPWVMPSLRQHVRLISAAPFVRLRAGPYSRDAKWPWVRQLFLPGSAGSAVGRPPLEGSLSPFRWWTPTSAGTCPRPWSGWQSWLSSSRCGLRSPPPLMTFWDMLPFPR